MKYIFLHIGKTAGTSFRTFLEENIPNHFWGYHSLQYLVNVDEQILEFTNNVPQGYNIFKNYDLFNGHIRYGLHKFIDDEVKYITMFRDPLTRTISAFRYGNDRGWYGKDVSILQWFTQMDDVNFRYKHYQMNHILDLEEYKTIKDGKDKIKICLERIQQDNFMYGFVEKYDDFLDICCSNFGWKYKSVKTNITNSKTNIGEDEKEMLNELLKYEIEFYNKSFEIYNDKHKKVLI